MGKVRWGKSTYGMMRYMARYGDGVYRLQWQGHEVAIVKIKQCGYNWVVRVDRVTRFYAATLDAAMHWVDNVWGNEQVETHNLLNPKAGKVMIARKNRGGCCDPGTETYWSM